MFCGHSFPKQPELKNAWKKFCNNRRTWEPKRTSVICSTHFQTSDFQVLANNRRRLVENAVPRLIPDCICSSHQPLPDGAYSSATPNLMSLMTSLGETASQQQTSTRMTGTVSAVDEGAAPVKDKRESDGQDEGGAGDFCVVVKEELEVGPEQLQPQDIAWAVKEEPGWDEESGFVVDDQGELKMKVEVAPEELQMPAAAGLAQSTGRTLEPDDTPTKLSPQAKLSSRKCQVHVYCSVFGCLVNDLDNPELSFFKIPVKRERRKQWLQLILREDLFDKTTINRVCEIHFHPRDIRKSKRSTLKNFALPTLNLPDKLKEDKQTQTIVETAVSSSQTDETAINNSNQTERSSLVSDSETQTSLAADSLRKRKLKSDLQDCQKRVKTLHNDVTGAESQINMFHELCDRFLASDLAELVKAQTTLILS